MIKYIFMALVIIISQVLWARENVHVEFEIITNENLSIAEVVEAALYHSPEHDVITSKGRYAKALKRQASGLLTSSPILSINHQNDRLISNQGLREWESSLSLPLWMPGEKSASKQKARMSEEEAKVYDEIVLLQLTGEVREVLWNLHLAAAALDQSRKNLINTESLTADINRRIAAGNLPKQNALLSEGDVMTRQMELLNAEADYIDAARQYENLTGLREMPAYFEEVVAEGLKPKDHPSLKLYRAKIDFLQAAYMATRKSLGSNPTFSVGVKRERAMLQDRYIGPIGFGLTMPLGGGAVMTSKRMAAALELAEMERDGVLLERDYRLRLHEAEHELEVCALKMPLSAQHFNMAKENLRLSKKAFDLGETDLIDFLRVQEQSMSSSYDNIKIKIECKRAISRHNQTKGVLLQ